MAKLSLVMIVKNEEKVLNRCLNSIKKAVDEIIIVDTGSTDNTKNIALKFTNKVFDFKWINDFSVARNYAISKATGNYIMWLDADDVVPLKTTNAIIKLKQNMQSDTYMLKYDIITNNQVSLSFYRERIIKNCNLCYFQGCVHEVIAPFGKIEYLNLSVQHKKVDFSNSNRNINIYNTILKERELSPREQYYYGRELFDHKKYKKCSQVLKKFINCGLGWVENVIDACVIISICYMKLANPQNQIFYLLKTLEYDAPRANVACMIGDYFLNNNQINTAIFWYSTAVNSNKEIKGFVNPIYYNYYPYLQLCVCYYKLNDIKKSEHYNNLAHKTNTTIVTQTNKNFFEKIKKDIKN